MQIFLKNYIVTCSVFSQLWKQQCILDSSQVDTIMLTVSSGKLQKKACN